MDSDDVDGMIALFCQTANIDPSLRSRGSQDQEKTHDGRFHWRSSCGVYSLASGCLKRNLPPIRAERAVVGSAH